MSTEEVEADLREYARVTSGRDSLIREALRAGITKHRIHVLTGISRSTIDRALKEKTMTTTTEYGTWNNHGDSSALTVEDSVTGYISGGDSEWRERIQEDGSFDAMVAAYREAINDALPEGVSLNGDEFYGPYPREDVDIAAIIEGIDLGAIVDEHDPDND